MQTSDQTCYLGHDGPESGAAVTNRGALQGHQWRLQHADEDTIRRRTGGTDEVLFDTHLTQHLPKQMAHE